jgi:hypothetical protein
MTDALEVAGVVGRLGMTAREVDLDRAQKGLLDEKERSKLEATAAVLATPAAQPVAEALKLSGAEVRELLDQNEAFCDGVAVYDAMREEARDAQIIVDGAEMLARGLVNAAVELVLADPGLDPAVRQAISDDFAKIRTAEAEQVLEPQQQAQATRRMTARTEEEVARYERHRKLLATMAREYHTRDVPWDQLVEAARLYAEFVGGADAPEERRDAPRE